MIIYLGKSCSFDYHSIFPFGFEGGIWDLIALVPDHCLSFDLPIVYLCCIPFFLQYNVSGSNTDGSFTTAVSNWFFSPLENIL